ncbi:MAG: T9SS type A sorting domain-containing protein [Parafilimonas sp.]
MKTILFSFIFCLMSACLIAQSGTLDSSFGVNGVVYNNNKGVINQIVLQHNGKIITGGAGGTIKNPFLLARYNSDGSVDSSFGKNGNAGTNELSEVFAMTVQNDDKIVAFGHDAYLKLVRYKSDGRVDSSFGTAGIVNTSVGIGADVPVGIVTQPDNKIISGGYIINLPNEQRQGYLIRYLNNGSLDTNFGDSGKVIFNTPDANSAIDIVTAIALAPNNKIIVSLSYVSSLQARAYRFNTDGIIDSSFGINGRAEFQSQTGLFNSLQVTDIVVQPNGKIIGCGTVSMDNNIFKGNISISCLNKDGSIDSSFGNNGLAYAAFGQNASTCKSVLLQKDGKIISLGSEYSLDYTRTYFALTRFTSVGKIDSTFGNDDLQTTQAGNQDYLSSAALQHDGKILSGGNSGPNDVLIRYNNDALSKKQIIITKIKHYIQTHNNANAVSKLATISLYPNPVNNLLSIKGLDAIYNYELLMMNDKGAIIKQASANNISSYQFNVQNLSSGVYYVSVISNGKTFTTLKFVK